MSESCKCENKVEEILSESDYSEDDESKSIDPAIRAKYPHLSVAKILSMQKAWIGRAALHKKRRSAVQELALLKKQLAEQKTIPANVDTSRNPFDGII